MMKNSLKKFYLQKAKTINFFSVFILVLVSLFIISVVKHQEVTVQQQIVEVEVTGKDWTANQAQFEGYRPPHWLLENVSIGSTEFSPEGRVVAEVLDIDYYERNGGNVQVFLTIQLETVDNFSSGRTVYKGKNIEIGEKVDFHFNQTLIVGQIISINDPENYEDKLHEIKLTGLYRNIPRYIADEISVGDEVINPYTNEHYVSILEKKVLPASDYFLSAGKFGSGLYLRPNYSLVDLELVLTVKVKQAFGSYFYGGHQQIKIGESLALFFPQYNIDRFEIQSVEETTTSNE